VVLAAAAVALPGADRTVSFATDIQPIFQRTCWNCHGPKAQLSKLNLGSRDLAIRGGDRGASLVPGSAEKSRLFRMVAGLEKPSMPLGGTLSAGEIESIRLWIDRGAVWDAGAAVSSNPGDITQDNPLRPDERNYWAFRLPVRPSPPNNVGNPIDAFIVPDWEG